MIKTKTNINIISLRYIKFSKIVILLLLLFTLFRIYNEHITIAFVDVSAAFLLFINLKLNITTQNKINIFLFIIIIILSIFLYNGNSDSFLIYWIFGFPTFTYLLNNSKGGVIWSIIFGLIIFSAIFLQIFFNIQTGHSYYDLFIFTSAYIVLSFLTYLFQKEVDLYIFKLQELNTSLNDLVDKEIKKNERKDIILNAQAKQAQMGEMVAMIAHQWRQPLNAINASAIKMKLENEMNLLDTSSINETSNFIQAKAQYMSEIINNFLDFSKLNKKDNNFFIIDSIEKTIKIIETQFNIHSIEIRFIYPYSIKDKLISGSKNLLEQVLLNLLINARDAFKNSKIDTKKYIKISINEFWNISVEDNAGSISDNIINKIFNPYFTTKEEGEGTGLGLYMSRKIMRTHFQGNLIYESSKNNTTFKVILFKET